MATPADMPQLRALPDVCKRDGCAKKATVHDYGFCSRRCDLLATDAALERLRGLRSSGD